VIDGTTADSTAVTEEEVDGDQIIAYIAYAMGGLLMLGGVIVGLWFLITRRRRQGGSFFPTSSSKKAQIPLSQYDRNPTGHAESSTSLGQYQRRPTAPGTGTGTQSAFFSPRQSNPLQCHQLLHPDQL
jgi:hypothetical protein